MARKRKKEDDNSYDIPPFPLYVILACGIIVIIAGLYLLIKNSYANGISLAGRYGGNDGGHIVLDGRSLIIIGVLFCIFPLYQLIKQRDKKSK